MQQQAAEGEGRRCREEVEGDEAGKVAAGGLEMLVRMKEGERWRYLAAGEHQFAAED